MSWGKSLPGVSASGLAPEHVGILLGVLHLRVGSTQAEKPALELFRSATQRTLRVPASNLIRIRIAPLSADS